MKHNAALLIGGPLNGGIVTAIIWWVVNDLWKVGGVGLLARQAWPISSIYVCAAIGAATGLGLAIVLNLRRARDADGIAALCQRLNFQYIRHVAPEQLPSYHSLRLFEPRRWHEAANLMSGRVDGVEVELLDYEFVEHGDESTTHYRQTIALFPDCGSELPPFELVPRGLIIKVFYRAAGLEGVTFEPTEQMSDWEREAVERFGRLYFLIPPLNTLRQMWEQQRVREELASSSPQPAALASDPEPTIRHLFNLELLRFFAERSGWSIESDGRNLALWRSRKTVPTTQREQFIREASAIRSALLKAAAGESKARSLSGTMKMIDPRRREDATTAWVLGSFLGFFAGAAIGFGVVGLLIWLRNDPPVGLVFPIFFGCPISGFILGGAISYRWQRQRRVASRVRNRTGYQIDTPHLREADRPIAVTLKGTERVEGIMTLTVDSRTIDADCRPLAGTESANFRTRRLVRRDSLLVLRPSRRSRLFAIVLLAMGVGFVAMGIALPFFWRDWPAELGGVLAKVAMMIVYPIVWLAALLFSGCGLLFLFGVAGTVLDCGTGRLHYVPKLKWRSVSRPLADILAVQLIRGELHSVYADNEPPYQSYQLNLVLDDPAEPRINLCDHTDVAWQFEAGREIAEFLGRPMIDRVSDSGVVIPERDGRAER